MRQENFKSFIRSGGSKAFVLDLSRQPFKAVKQADADVGKAVRRLVEGTWDSLFAATTRDILRSERFELSTGKMSDLDL